MCVRVCVCVCSLLTKWFARSKMLKMYHVSLHIDSSHHTTLRSFLKRNEQPIFGGDLSPLHLIMRPVTAEP